MTVTAKRTRYRASASRPGLTATRAIRTDLGLRSLPVIALSEGVMAEEQQQALDAGVNDFLPKPMNLEQMTNMILRYCRPS